MAIIKQGVLGAFSGKVGTVIGTSWKGIAIIRGIAASIANPRTPAQMEQRAKFTLVVKFLRTITAFLRIGFQSAAVKMSGFNAALSYNVQNAITGLYPDFTLDYTKLRVTQGTLPGALNPDAAPGAAASVNFTWEDNSLDGGSMANDKVMLLVYNPAKGQSVTAVGNMTRADGAQTLALPEAFSGDTVQCYISFTNANESVVSDSLYVGNVLVA